MPLTLIEREQQLVQELATLLPGTRVIASTRTAGAASRVGFTRPPEIRVALVAIEADGAIRWAVTFVAGALGRESWARARLLEQLTQAMEGLDPATYRRLGGRLLRSDSGADAWEELLLQPVAGVSGQEVQFFTATEPLAYFGSNSVLEAGMDDFSTGTPGSSTPAEADPVAILAPTGAWFLAALINDPTDLRTRLPLPQEVQGPATLVRLTPLGTPIPVERWEEIHDGEPWRNLATTLDGTRQLLQLRRPTFELQFDARDREGMAPLFHQVEALAAFACVLPDGSLHQASLLSWRRESRPEAVRLHARLRLGPHPVPDPEETS
jgi:hypothetical protein